MQASPHPSYGPISLIIEDTLLNSIMVAGKLTSQPAYHLKISDRPGRNPAADAPVIFNIYKFYPATGLHNLICRIYGGGAGNILHYRNDNGRVDTLVYKTSLDTVIILGAQDKNKFYFEVAPLMALSGGPDTYYGGFEDKTVRDNVLRGGGLSRMLAINPDKDNLSAVYTADNRVRVAARFSTAGVDTISYIRYSAQSSLSFSTLLAMDSIIRYAGPSDTLFVRVDANLRIRLADSMVFSNGGIEQGKFGGRIAIPADSLHLSKFFETVKPEYSSNLPGDTGWFSVAKKDTLLTGLGQKWICIYHSSWDIPLFQKIDIQPYAMEILLDYRRANARYKGLNICLLQDEIPFNLNTFGDTTFDEEVWVWMATRNCSARFLDVSSGQFKDNQLEQNSMPFFNTGKFWWPDAILETPPVRFYIPRNNNTYNGTLNPDYEAHYRVSPLMHLYYDSKINSSGGGLLYNANDKDNTVCRLNNYLLSQTVTKGSVLGYSEASLGNFKAADSILIGNELGTLRRIPFTGWFEIEPLENVSPDGTYNPNALVSKFQDKFGVDSLLDLFPSKDATVIGRTYYSIYSAYLFTPDLPSGTQNPYDFASGGIKLYKNPMRNIPPFLAPGMSGAKEFVLCAYTRGRFFKEPRVMISVFSSNIRYYWDKVAPGFSWDTASSPTASHYAPLCFINKNETKITDLGATLTPYVFDVWLSTANPSENVDCSLRDVGFGRIVSATLCFNYSTDLLRVDPVTGFRNYKRNSIKIPLPSAFIEGQKYQAIANAAFKNIDARQWQGGIWDMWLETEDDLENKGVAPFISSNNAYGVSTGRVSVRQIKIR